MNGRLESTSSERVCAESRRRRRSSAELTISCGSIHSCRGLICARLIRVASRRFWISLLRRSASSRTTPASEVSRSSLAITADLLNTVAAPRIEASGVRNSCETEPISASRNSSVSERILASLSARAVEPLERSCGIGEHVVDTLAYLVDVTRPDATEIDGDDAEVGVFLRYAAHQPDVAGAVVHRGRERAPGLNLRNRGMHALRQRTLVGFGIAIAAGARSEQHHLALDEACQVLLDREIDVRGG